MDFKSPHYAFVILALFSQNACFSPQSSSASSESLAAQNVTNQVPREMESNCLRPRDFTFTDGVSTSSASFQALTQKLETLSRRWDELVGLSTPGGLRPSRLHIDEQNRARAMELITSLDAEFASAHASLTTFRDKHRMDSVQNKPMEFSGQNAIQLFSQFNEQLEISKHAGIVIGNENLGGLGRPRRIAQNLSALPLTPFDFTTGFAVQCHKSYSSGIVAHLNRQTGRVSWHSRYESSVAVDGVDGDGCPILKTSYLSGLSSARNEKTGKWEIHNGIYRRSSASVYDEAAQKVVHRDANYYSGMSLVYHPVRREVMEKQVYYSGVAGYFDPVANEVKWEESYNAGVACIWRMDGKYFTSAGTYGFDEDDDD